MLVIHAYWLRLAVGLRTLNRAARSEALTDSLKTVLSSSKCGACLELAVQVVGDVADLNHLGYARNISTLDRHAFNAQNYLDHLDFSFDRFSPKSSGFSSLNALSSKT